MSVKFKDLLKLPSLRDAEVVAGEKGLEKLVSTISVLEQSSVTKLRKELFNNDEKYGSEVVISGLINISHDVDDQVKMIRHLQREGETGLILYYVGVFIPEVDEKVLNVCDELNFPLIIMPKGEPTLRYSEVIYEVVEAIVKQEMQETNFASSMLEQISELPSSQRTMDTLVKMLTDRTRSSIVLTDTHDQMINAETWPHISTLDLAYMVQHTRHEDINFVKNVSTTKRSILQNGMKAIYLYIFKENDPLTEVMVEQILEVVQVYMNLWGQNYEVISTAELVKAILHNESVKMRRLGGILRVNVEAISNMWIVNIKHPTERTLVMKKLRAELALRFNVFLVELFDNAIIVLMDDGKGKEDFELIALDISEKLKSELIEHTIIQCLGMKTTIDVQEAYIKMEKHLIKAKSLYPKQMVYSQLHIQFAEECGKIILEGEKVIKEKLIPLQPLIKDDELLETLAVFLLDADSQYSEAAKELYVHTNTIKYRIKRINEKLHYPVTKLPESLTYYRAISIWRLLKTVKL